MKVKTMLEIINLQKKYADNSKAVNDLNTITGATGETCGLGIHQRS